jgi:penicillin-binding protein 1B
MIHDLGVKSQIPEFPSILLGALEMSPIEVQQMYQTIAAGGQYSPLKAIRSVMNTEGETLSRYPITVQQVASPAATYLVTHTMHEITTKGTAKALSGILPSWKKVAGKTGTTNNKRDSWFAGFSGEHVISVWVGRDDNKPTNLTGGSGALRVWGDLMKVLPTKPFNPKRPKNVRWIKIDKQSGAKYNPACGSSIILPFIKGSEPKKARFCAPPPTVNEPFVDENTVTPQAQQSNWIDRLVH